MAQRTQVYNRNGIVVTIYQAGFDYIVARETDKEITEHRFKTREAAIEYCKSHALYEKADFKITNMPTVMEQFREKRSQTLRPSIEGFEYDNGKNLIHNNPIIEIT